jgi:DNA-binding response OmpR family regulator
MDICCPHCGGLAEPAGHEDARAFFRCPACDRVWATHISAISDRRLSPDAPAPRVLVADDSPEMLGLLTAWLEDEGCLVIAVGSGREALEASVAYRPDVAILDVVLPPPDGFQLCEILTRRDGPAVVLMTGMSNPDSRRAAEAGALMLLAKPFEREALIDALTLGLERSRAQGRGASAGRAPGSKPAAARARY